MKLVPRMKLFGKEEREEEEWCEKLKNEEELFIAHNCKEDVSHHQPTVSTLVPRVLLDPESRVRLVELNTYPIHGHGNYDEYAISIFRAMVQNTSVQEFHLTSPLPKRPNVRLAFADMIAKNTSLQELNLTNGKLDKHMMRALETNKSITHLSLWLGSMGEGEAEMIARLLTVNDTLQSLAVRHRYVSAQDVKVIAHALESKCTLRKLILASSCINDEGAKFLAKLLHNNNNNNNNATTLKVLDLRGNEIRNVGAIALANALLSNECLEELCIQSNKVSILGALAFAKMLKVQSSIRKLHLHYNLIGKSGCEALAKAMTMNTNVTHLNMFGAPHDQNTRSLLMKDNRIVY